MMTKQTSRSRAIIKKIALAPVLALLIFVFADKDAAAQADIRIDPPLIKGAAQADVTIDPPLVKEKTASPSRGSKEDYYKGSTIKFIHKDRSFVIKKYDDMSAEEKKNLPKAPIPPALRKPLQAAFDEWKSSDKYGIWVDGKHISNQELESYKPSDFIFYWNSRLLKAAQHYGNRRFQIDLYTPGYFDEVYVKPLSNPDKNIVINTMNGVSFVMQVRDFKEDQLAIPPPHKKP